MDNHPRFLFGKCNLSSVVGISPIICPAFRIQFITSQSNPTNVAFCLQFVPPTTAERVPEKFFSIYNDSNLKSLGADRLIDIDRSPCVYTFSAMLLVHASRTMPFLSPALCHPYSECSYLPPELCFNLS